MQKLNLDKEIEFRKLKALELQKFRNKLENERRIQRLTIEETHQQLMKMRKEEMLKQQIIREGLRYKTLMEQKKIRKAEETAQMIESLKDAALKLSLKRENLKRKQKTEAAQLLSEVENTKREIETEKMVHRASIKSQKARGAALRHARLVTGRNKIKYLKIKAMKDILSAKLKAEEAIYKRKLEEHKKIKKLECDARKNIKKLRQEAIGLDKQSAEMLKKDPKLLHEKADEINVKRNLINSYRLKIHALEESEIKQHQRLSAIEHDTFNNRALTRLTKEAHLRKIARMRRVREFQRKLERVYEDRKKYLFKKRCVRFRKAFDKKIQAQQEERRKRKIAQIICGGKFVKKTQHRKCYDFIGGKYHKLVRSHGHHYGCPFEKRHGITKCQTLELP
ncbi:Coiled-coil domain containing protein [Entamoeba marina]